MTQSKSSFSLFGDREYVMISFFFFLLLFSIGCVCNLEIGGEPAVAFSPTYLYYTLITCTMWLHFSFFSK